MACSETEHLTITRRQAIGAAAGGLCLPLATGEPGEPGFRHRAYLGWITDLSSRPDTNAPWPSMRLDAALLEDYGKTFSLMKQLGYNAIVIWGFYVSRSWPLDISTAVPKERGALVGRLIDGAHEQGIRVYTGLEVADRVLQAPGEMIFDGPQSLLSLPGTLLEGSCRAGQMWVQDLATHPDPEPLASILKPFSARERLH